MAQKTRHPLITKRHFQWISIFRGREFRLGKQMEFPSVNHNERV